MQAVLFAWVAVGGIRAFGYASVESQSACLEIVQKAEESTVPGDSDRAHVVLTQCQLRHPDGVFSKEQGAPKDCQELARLYQLARHYSHQGVTPAEFCRTLQTESNTASLTSDSRTMSHTACTAGLSKVLGSQQLGEAADEACLRIYSTVNNVAAMCKKLVNVLADVPDDGTLDSGRLCDRLLTGGNGTRRLDREHFLYSCVQYASNVVADSPSDGLNLAAQDVHRSCHQHFSVGADAEKFCSGYAELVRRHATHSDISQFCGAQYEVLGGEVSGQKAETKQTSQSSVGMTAMCQQAAAQVVSADSDLQPGRKLQQNAEHVCAMQFQALAPKAPRKQVHAGCRFFAKHFDDEVKRSGADVDIDSFCDSLGGHPAQTPQAPAAPTEAPQPHREAMIQDAEVDDSSLGGFLSAFDVGSAETTPVPNAPQEKKVEVPVQAAPAETDDLALPELEVAKLPEVTAPPLPAQAEERSSNQKNTGFLRSVSPHTVEPAKNTQAALQMPAVSGPPNGGNGNPDIDTLVSLFQSP